MCICQNHSEILSHTFLATVIKMRRELKKYCKYSGEKREPSCTVDVNGNWFIHYRKWKEVPRESKMNFLGSGDENPSANAGYMISKLGPGRQPRYERATKPGVPVCWTCILELELELNWTYSLSYWACMPQLPCLEPAFHKRSHLSEKLTHHNGEWQTPLATTRESWRPEQSNEDPA